MDGVIFDIQRFAVHDGPGIRSTVFFKGCSARCAWCHNPESFTVKPQLELRAERCIGCGKCVTLCPESAHTFDGGAHSIDRTACTACGICAAECFADALMIAGRSVTIDEVMTTLLADRAYYEESGGGVTLSGGEPVLQHTFAAELLRRLRAEGIHTAIQTAGFYKYELIEPLLPCLDLVMYDIKAWSRDIYDRYINAPRELALDNLTRLSNASIPIVVRTPVVHPVNDTEEEIVSIARFLQGLKNIERYMLLTYHALGKVKYDALGEAYQAFAPAPAEQMARLEAAAAPYVTVYNLMKGVIEPT